MIEFKEKEINDLAVEIHNQNKERGWWDDPNRCIVTVFQLIITEVCEATEGDRKNIMDDHLPHRKMAEVEMADVMIRLLDAAGKLGLQYDNNYIYNLSISKGNSVPEHHFSIIRSIIFLLDDVLASANYERSYSLLIFKILYLCEQENYDLRGAMTEKLEYNKKRADHNRSNREKSNGKKY